mgnify:CR=1 FL=1
MNESVTFKDRLIQDAQAPAGPEMKLFFIRRGAGDFASTLDRRIREVQMTKIHFATQTESDGAISLTVFYS